jgi:subtilisin family serine protease
VLDCSGEGTTAQVVAGVDWVTGDHHPGQPAVANMSLGGDVDDVLDAAVAGSIADGVSYAVAAGNDDVDACGHSPARTPTAITVGATGGFFDENDDRAWFSNYGTCLDIFAPGVDIVSATNTGDTATETLSGTSMATPHVTGVAALYLQTHPAATPAMVSTALNAAASKGVVRTSSRYRTANNNLLFTNY